MKKHFILLAYLILSNACFGQLYIQYRTCLSCDTSSIGQKSNVIYHYGPVTDYDANLVADDYGPRMIPKSGVQVYDWHGGIDYNSNSSAQNDDDRGDLIIAIEGGTIGVINF